MTHYGRSMENQRNDAELKKYIGMEYTRLQSDMIEAKGNMESALRVLESASVLGEGIMSQTRHNLRSDINRLGSAIVMLETITEAYVAEVAATMPIMKAEALKAYWRDQLGAE